MRVLDGGGDRRREGASHCNQCGRSNLLGFSAGLLKVLTALGVNLKHFCFVNINYLQHYLNALETLVDALYKLINVQGGPKK